MDIENARFNMVEQQIKTWKVNDIKVLNAFFTIRRELFVSEKFKDIAFSDIEIPLPGNQKMLLPKVEARLIQELDIKNTDIILEIGTGSGFVTSILAKLAKTVYTVEINQTNKEFAETNLKNAQINNVNFHLGNGIYGLANINQVDKIFVNGGLITLNNKLKQQLKAGGKLVGFIGKHPLMHAILVEKIASSHYIESRLFETDIEYLSGETDLNFKF